jgi:hypothetical protein
MLEGVDVQYFHRVAGRHHYLRVVDVLYIILFFLKYYLFILIHIYLFFIYYLFYFTLVIHIPPRHQ